MSIAAPPVDLNRLRDLPAQLMRFVNARLQQAQEGEYAAKDAAVFFRESLELMRGWCRHVLEGGRVETTMGEVKVLPEEVDLPVKRVLCSAGCCLECEECSAKPGTPALCESCLERRAACPKSRAKAERAAPAPSGFDRLQVAEARVKELEAENARLRQQVEGHCRRIADQSELLSRRAEKAPAAPADEETLRYNLSCYLTGHLSFKSFQAWFVPATWDVEEWGSLELQRMAHRVALHLAEYTSGHRSEEELGEALREAREDWLEPAEQSGPIDLDLPDRVGVLERTVSRLCEVLTGHEKTLSRLEAAVAPRFAPSEEQYR